MTARIVPGSPDDPGAREACVTTFIDRKLAEYETFAVPTYADPPFARLREPGQPPPPGAGPLFTDREELDRYGRQGSLTPQQAYRRGLAQLDEYATRVHGGRFLDLAEPVQDRVLQALEAGSPEGFDDPNPDGFFELAQQDTFEGMFSDPVYGGNRNLVGWTLIGYPGAQRAYTPAELTSGPNNRRVQGLQELPPQHPGTPRTTRSCRPRARRGPRGR